jgi:hypothetical protein
MVQRRGNVLCDAQKVNFLRVAKSRTQPTNPGIYLKYASSPKKMVNAPVTINGLVTLPT